MLQVLRCHFPVSRVVICHRKPFPRSWVCPGPSPQLWSQKLTWLCAEWRVWAFLEKLDHNNTKYHNGLTYVKKKQLPMICHMWHFQIWILRLGSGILENPLLSDVPCSTGLGIREWQLRPMWIFQWESSGFQAGVMGRVQSKILRPYLWTCCWGPWQVQTWPAPPLADGPQRGRWICDTRVWKP